MRYAKDADGLRVKATATGQRAECPGCGAEVMSKFGSIVIPHWSHVSSADCDAWYEPITAWHLWWQNQFPEEWREVTITGNDGKQHRADILIPGWGVVEVQHSSISAGDINKRDTFYKHHTGDIAWIVDGRDFMNRFMDVSHSYYRILNDLEAESQHNVPKRLRTSAVRWKISRRSWGTSNEVIMFDRGTADGKRISGRFDDEKTMDVFIWTHGADGRSWQDKWKNAPYDPRVMFGQYTSRNAVVNGLLAKAVT